MTRTYLGMFDEAIARDTTHATDTDNVADRNAEALREMVALTSGDAAVRTDQQRQALREMMEMSNGPISQSLPKKPDDGAREHVRERGDKTDMGCDRPHGVLRSRYQGNER